MKKYLALVLVMVCGFFLFSAQKTHALGIKVDPLLYKETLQPGEKKKGFIDISNPNDETMTFQTEIKAFKQINNNGDLEFYQKPEYYSGGIQLDYNNFTLGPREALRLYFLIDSNKLPSGSITAAIFFKTTSSGANPDNTSLQPIAEVGTLLVVQNGGSAKKQAAISAAHVPFFQIGKSINSQLSVTNTGDSTNGLAFFPAVNGTVQPYGSKNQLEAPLVFPGITRKEDMQFGGSYFGLVRLKFTAENSAPVYKWAFVITGAARWYVPLLLVVAGCIVFVLRRYKRSQPIKK